jgi:hypothetical protein
MGQRKLPSEREARVRSLLRELAFRGPAVPDQYARPPREAVLTMRDVRAAHAGARVMVVEPQEYERVAALDPTRLGDFYPRGNGQRRNERTGIRQGEGAALTGSGGDEWWVVNDALVAWLTERTRRARSPPRARRAR